MEVFAYQLTPLFILMAHWRDDPLAMIVRPDSPRTPDPPGEDLFSRLGALASGSSEVVLFSPWKEGFLIPLSLDALLGEIIAPLLSPLLPSMGATSNILTSTGYSAVSGRGAGHLISLDCATHSCEE